MKRHAKALSLLLLVACGPDETVTAFASTDIYGLRLMNGAVVQDGTTLDIGQTGRISGESYCNSYSAPQTAPYPWFEIGPVAATRNACPELAAETAYLDLLGRVALVEVSGDTLILSNTDGVELVFQALP